jgi:hypothetical protein
MPRFRITFPPGRSYHVRASRAPARVGYFHGAGELVEWSISDPRPPRGQARFGGVYFPHWLAACAAGLPGISVVTRRGVRRWRKRHRHGLCVCCGYDLRATPGRCPECGTIPAVPPAA